MDTRKLAWSRKDIRSPGYWRALDNHNRVCERYIGKMAVVSNRGRLRNLRMVVWIGRSGDLS